MKITKNYRLLIFCAFIIGLLYLAPQHVGAFSFWEDILGIDPNSATYGSSNVAASDVNSYVQTGLTLGISGLALAFVGVGVYGGILWSSAGDNQEQLAKAKGIFKNGGIAFGIVFGFLILFGFIAAVMGIDITNVDLANVIF